MTVKQPPKPAFDLADLDTISACNKGFEFELKHPSSLIPLGMFITVLGVDSDRYREVTNERSDANTKKAIENRRAGRENDIVSAEQIDRNEIELLAALTTGWREIAWNGTPFAFNAANAMKLYRERPFIKNQVNAAISDMRNFI